MLTEPFQVVTEAGGASSPDVLTPKLPARINLIDQKGIVAIHNLANMLINVKGCIQHLP